MVIEASVLRELAVFFLTPASQGHEPGVVELRLLTDTPRDFVTVHAWHADIQQDHIWPVSGEHPKRRRSAVNGFGVKPH